MSADIRRNQIIRLLETRDDHLPQPARRVHTIRGFTHRTTARVTCPDCLANDRVMFGCETCAGRGFVEEQRERDPYAVEQVQPYGITADRKERARDRDAEIDRLGGLIEEGELPALTEADALAAANASPYRWEKERERKWAAHDYAALDAALAVLRDRDEGAYRLLHAVYVYGWCDHSVVVEAAVQRGLRFLDERMPDPIRAPALAGEEAEPEVAKESLWRGRSERHAQAREARRGRVLRAHLDWGWSTAQIAAHESLTARRVRQIVADHFGQRAGSEAAVASGPAA